MIMISGSLVSLDDIIKQYQLDTVETKIMNILFSSNTVYSYDSTEQLRFEASLRKSIIGASLKLYRSYFSFRTFRDSVCNPDYWIRTNEGGFLLKRGINPSDGINDIYTNSSKYGTECATAIDIVFYKGLLDILPQELFNRLFAGIYLMDWQHLDSDLGIEYYRNPADHLPGDCRYFKNPDVSPETPEWQGENTIDLGNGTYYGHGMGIKTADEIIGTLNRYRVEGSVTSAYLMNSATRPNFRSLADKYLGFGSRRAASSLGLAERRQNRPGAVRPSL